MFDQRLNNWSFILNLKSMIKRREPLIEVVLLLHKPEVLGLGYSRERLRDDDLSHW